MTVARDGLVAAIEAGWNEAIRCDCINPDTPCPSGAGSVPFNHEAAHVRAWMRKRVKEIWRKPKSEVAPLVYEVLERLGLDGEKEA